MLNIVFKYSVRVRLGEIFRLNIIVKLNWVIRSEGYIYFILEVDFIMSIRLNLLVFNFI